MKIWQAHRLMLLCSVIIFMTLVSSTVAAQDELLTNPGFESPFEPVEGVMPGQIAQGWLPWFSTDSGALEPEYYAASDEASGLGSPRIRNGSDAQQYFSFFSTHIAGVYQPVGGIVAGSPLEFSVYSWLWSSNLDDVNVSDAEAAMTIEVGIDPTGGQDATSANIIWSAPVSIFDEFFQSKIAAVAQSDIVTVFVRSVITEPLRNSVVYLDDAALVVTEITDTAMTAEVTAEMAATEIPVEATVETVITEVATVEVTAEIVATEVSLVEVTTEVTDVATLEATAEVTDEIVAIETATVEATVEVIATAIVTSEATVEIGATDVATLAATVELVATLVPTVEAPTVVPSTAVPILEPTSIATEVPTIVPSPTLNLTVFPLSVTYIVQNFDIVVDIANQYGTTVDAIIIANGLNENALIFVGQELVIPVQTLPQPTSTPTETISVQVVPVTEAATMAAEAAISAQITPTATQAVQRYTVQYGDSLSSIAARFGTTTRALARLNRIVNANLVYRGQVLIISGANVVVSPTPTATLSSATATATMAAPTATQTAYRGTYRIMPGDTLYFISIRFNVRISDLIQINNIVDPNRVYVGQVLNIP